MISPRSEGVAFRIWAYAQPLGWNCTNAQIADAIDESVHVVGNICSLKKWQSRLRVDTARGVSSARGTHLRSQMAREVESQIEEMRFGGGEVDE